MAVEKFEHASGYFVAMGFNGKVTGVEKTDSLFGFSRLNASAPCGVKKGAFLPQMAMAGRRNRRKYSCRWNLPAKPLQKIRFGKIRFALRHPRKINDLSHVDSATERFPSKQLDLKVNLEILPFALKIPLARAESLIHVLFGLPQRCLRTMDQQSGSYVLTHSLVQIRRKFFYGRFRAAQV
jgi:hypothetical protein